MALAPIALFVYNRPWHTRKTLEALSKSRLADQTVLYVFSDGPKPNDAASKEKIAAVREVLRERQWCKEIHIKEWPQNVGVAPSIIDGITTVVNKHGKIIVLEDDLVVSTGFLEYMNDALDLYETQEPVMHVAATILPLKETLPDTFFYNTVTCSGWATWQRAWNHLRTDPQELLDEIKTKGLLDQFNIEGTENFASQLERCITGELNTWAIKWYSTVFLNKGLCLHPKKSLVRNIGWDGSGMHTGINFDYMVDEPLESLQIEQLPLIENEQVRGYARAFYTKINNKTIPERILLKLRSIPIRIRNLAKR